MKRRFETRVALCLVLLLGVQILVAEGEDQATFSLVLSPGELTLDPLHAFRTTELQIATGIYEGLVVYHPATLRPMPGAAYKWEISEDRRNYTFYLRDRGRFSNGDPVTAKDFRESWLRIIDPSEDGEYSFFLDVITGAADYRAGTGNVDQVGIRVVDDFTLSVELVEPASHLLSMLCHMTFAPIHEDYRRAVDWGDHAPIITYGPFVLVESDQRTMVLEKNENYWDSWNVRLDAIYISRDTEAGAATAGLNGGTIDWSVTANSQRLEDTSLVEVAPLFATSYLFFRADREPWSDFRVRKGLAKLVSWSEVRDHTSPFATDHLVPSLGFYPPVEGLTEPDLESGLELLAAAGYPQGSGLPPITILVIPGSIADAAAREAADVWREELGVEVEIRGVSFDDYQDEIRQGGFTMGSSTWIGDFADPLAFLHMWTETSNLNDANYSDTLFDELVTKAMGESGEERFDALSKAERRLLSEEVVVIPLSHSVSVNFLDVDRIGGWFPNALDVHPLKNLYFKEPQIPQWYAGAANQILGVRSLRLDP